jgi:hypothetical protein
VYRVAELGAALADLEARGWERPSTWRSPTARAIRFGRTPGGHRIALYQLTRPELAAHFEGRRDFLPSVVLAGQVGYVVRLVLSRPERSYVVE